MSAVNIGGVSALNSKYTVETIFTPFVSSLLLIISLLAAIIIIKVINRIWYKSDEKFNVKFSKKIIFWLTILIALLTTIAFFYSQSHSFEYWSYGVENVEKASNYLPLTPIPAIRGGNITSDSAPILYQMVYFGANLLKQIEDKFNLIIAMTSAILIPLIIKIEKSEEK